MHPFDRDLPSAPAEVAAACGAASAADRLSRRQKVFAATLDAAGWAYLEERGVAPDERYRLLVEDCPAHGPCCVRVTFGALREHVEWVGARPADVAAALLATMLRPAGA